MHKFMHKNWRKVRIHAMLNGDLARVSVLSPCMNSRHSRQGGNPCQFAAKQNSEIGAAAKAAPVIFGS